MGPTRFELVTSSLSGTRSNQLSYEPLVGRGPLPALTGPTDPSCCGPNPADPEPRHVAGPVGRQSSPRPLDARSSVMYPTKTPCQAAPRRKNRDRPACRARSRNGLLQEPLPTRVTLPRRPAQTGGDSVPPRCSAAIRAGCHEVACCSVWQRGVPSRAATRLGGTRVPESAA